jgi:hypothetical protein
MLLLGHCPCSFKHVVVDRQGRFHEHSPIFRTEYSGKRYASQRKPLLTFS